MKSTPLLLLFSALIVIFSCQNQSTSSLENINAQRLALLMKSWEMKEKSTLNVIHTKWNFQKGGHLKREQTFDYLGIIDKVEANEKWKLSEDGILTVEDEINAHVEEYKMIDVQPDVLVLEKLDEKREVLTLHST